MNRRTVSPVFLLAAVVALSGASAGPGRARVFLIGLDAATWTVMDPLLKSGKLPEIERCIKSGTRGELATLAGFDSPALWTSAYTGKTPLKHGILDFLKNKKNGVSFTSDDRQAAALWNILSDAGRGVLAVELLMTYPAEAVDGVMISEEATRSRPDATFPPEAADRVETLQQAVDPEGARRFLGPAGPEGTVRGRMRGKLREIFQSDELAVRLAEAYLPERRWGLFGVHLWGLDQVPHLFGRYSVRDPRPAAPEDRAEFGETLDRYYAYTDGLVGRLLKAADPETVVFIVSDHGMGPDLRVPDRKGAMNGALAGAPYWQHDRGEAGVLVACGPGIRKGAVLKGASLLDLAPTVLYLEGLPVARDMDGKVLEGLLEPGRLKTEPVRFSPTYARTARRGGERLQLSPEQLQSLRDLGYLK